MQEEFRDDDAGFHVWPLESRPKGIAAILQAIADAAPGGVVIHCGAGKDRTGIVVALLLALAGVDRDAILADFMLTADRVTVLADDEPDHDQRAQLRTWLRPKPELLTEMLNRLDERQGSVAGYLRGAGVNDATQARLCHRLTGER